MRVAGDDRAVLHGGVAASLQAQALAPPPSGDGVGYARCVHRDREMFWAATEVADAAIGEVTTRGTVFHRIAE